MKKRKEPFKLESDETDEEHNRWAAKLTDEQINELAENTGKAIPSKQRPTKERRPRRVK